MGIDIFSAGRIVLDGMTSIVGLAEIAGVFVGTISADEVGVTTTEGEHATKTTKDEMTQKSFITSALENTLISQANYGLPAPNLIAFG